MKLSEGKKGVEYLIKKILDVNINAQAMRFGLTENEKITVFETIPKGPIVILKNNQEIAIGRELAEKIEIE